MPTTKVPDSTPAEIACPGNAVENNGNPMQTGIFDYILFGMQMPDRSYIATNLGYRFGFQSQEKDDEIKGEGNSINYKYRMHDPRIGRFFSIDPLAKEYPFYSPYAFSGNRVIDMVEQEGLQPVLPESRVQFYQNLSKLKTTDWKEIGEGVQYLGDVITGVGLFMFGTGGGALLIPYGKYLSGVGLFIETAANLSLGEYEEIAYDLVSFLAGKTLTKGFIKAAKVDIKTLKNEVKGTIEFGIDKCIIKPIEVTATEEVNRQPNIKTTQTQENTNNNSKNDDQFVLSPLDFSPPTQQPDKTRTSLPTQYEINPNEYE